MFEMVAGKRARKQLAKELTKTVIWCTVAVAIVVATANSSDLFNAKAEPVWFWGIIAILIFFPIEKYSLYRVITANTFEGTVTECRDKSVLKLDMTKKEADSSIRAVALMRNMQHVEGRIVTVRDRFGLTHKYVFKGHRQAAYAREMFREGERVKHLFGCKYPIPMERSSNQQFCFYCGLFPVSKQEVCPDCRCPYYHENTYIKESHDDL